jgi:hypothetical protein
MHKVGRRSRFKVEQKKNSSGKAGKHKHFSGHKVANQNNNLFHCNKSRTRKILSVNVNR